jgi:chromosome segregation ATPase
MASSIPFNHFEELHEADIKEILEPYRIEIDKSKEKVAAAHKALLAARKEKATISTKLEEIKVSLEMGKIKYHAMKEAREEDEIRRERREPLKGFHGFVIHQDQVDEAFVDFRILEDKENKIIIDLKTAKEGVTAVIEQLDAVKKQLKLATDAYTIKRHKLNEQQKAIESQKEERLKKLAALKQTVETAKQENLGTIDPIIMTLQHNITKATSEVHKVQARCDEINHELEDEKTVRVKAREKYGILSDILEANNAREKEGDPKRDLSPYTRLVPSRADVEDAYQDIMRLRISSQENEYKERLAAANGLLRIAKLHLKQLIQQETDMAITEQQRLTKLIDQNKLTKPVVTTTSTQPSINDTVSFSNGHLSQQTSTTLPSSSATDNKEIDKPRRCVIS